MQQPTKQTYEFGPFRLDPAKRVLLKEGEPVPLTPKAFDVLWLLVENHGHIVANAGVPVWWPAWCLAYDVGAAGALAWLLARADADEVEVAA